MIIPMYKYSFLIYHADYQIFAEKLKEKGVLHIIESDIDPGAEILDRIQKLNEVKRIQKLLDSRKEQEKIVSIDVPQDGQELILLIKSKTNELDSLHHQQQNLSKECEAVKPWGNFSWDTIHLLKEKNISVRFFYCATKKYKPEWENEFSIAKVADERGFTYFVYYDESGATIDITADEIRIPEKSLSVIEKELEDCNKHITAIELELDNIAKNGADILFRYEQLIQDELNDAQFVKDTSHKADGKIKWVEGWVPKSFDQEFETYIQTQPVYYIRSESEKAEKAPVLLKNGRFSKLFEPIGKLFSLPSYAEIDLTPFFAPFFFLFFGFCFGDAGYGLLFVFGAAFAKFKVKKDFKPILSLVQWLGVAAVIFGAITGTFFGIKLTDVEIPFFVQMKKHFLTDEQMFRLALVFGFFQIIFGMAIKVANQIKQEGWKYSLASAGWLLFIASTAIVIAIDAVNGTNKWMWSVPHLILAGLSALGIFIFNNPKGNILLNIGAGLWDTYNMITGFAGDLLSYIRLFALGLSSAILGLVFNSLAFELSPDIPVVGWIITGVILVFGHGLNIFMAALGSIVHPMRLTFVEFYKNAGFAGGGKEYKPFEKISQ